MSDKEKKILKIYDGSRPVEEDLFDSSTVNHVALSAAILLFGLVVWLALALVNAENQRFALESRKCIDAAFPKEIDYACMQVVKSRDNWWEHLWYGVTHLSPEKK